MTTITPETSTAVALAADTPPEPPARRGRRAVRGTSRRRADRATGAASYIVLSLGLVVTMLPLIWMVLGAFKPRQEFLADLGTWFPKNPTLDNFGRLFSAVDFGAAFLNSTLIVVITMASNVIFCSLFAYALAKIPFRGRRILMGAVVGSIMIPVIATFVPQFIVVANLKLVNTLLGIAVPFLVASVCVFIMRQYMESVPDELIEAARIDGASEFRIFFRVVMPLCGPAIVTMLIITGLANWNNFLWPLVVAQETGSYTLPVALAAVSQGAFETDYGALMAGSLLVMAPVLVVFLFLQRYFIQGVATAGLK
jgi:multiple sugar transport system permease protein